MIRTLNILFGVGALALIVLAGNQSISPRQTPLVLAPPPPEPEQVKVEPREVSGTIVVCGGKVTDDIAREFLRLAGGEQARLVVIPTASELADGPSATRFVEFWKERGPATVDMLHTRVRSVADQADFVEPLRHATGVWMSGGNQAKLTSAYLDTAVHRELRAILARGGVVGGTSAGAAALSEVMICGGRTNALLTRGFGLLPQAVVDTHWLQRGRVGRLCGVLDAYPGMLGLGVDESTAVVISARDMWVVGNSFVTTVLGNAVDAPVQFDLLTSGEHGDFLAYSEAALRRGAARSESYDLVEPPRIVVGGKAALPKDVVDRFAAGAHTPEEPQVIVANATRRTAP